MTRRRIYMLTVCDKCRRTEVPEAGDSLLHGWPRCCGVTMRVVGYADERTAAAEERRGAA